jgi:hypothetical protein
MLSPKLQRTVELTLYPLATGAFMIGWLCLWPVFQIYRRHSMRA